ncbi:hypothetical protein PC9H_007135 [Pleurotus ostreatus]|uniref:Uncharacterized protein n=1 Tax=Pleurotus ostreatus TaxID=5322 RepID=A0A8H6ZUU2_PLEOS|nr:uncharacterized protein PC9H_007135 [Pleurotus ostreatus]KAF7427918.1 hypothetical protein PC9H_007135 [Pleurotus ostreatus]
MDYPIDADVEDILNDSLTLLGGEPVSENELIQYGPLKLTIAPKANTLLADHLFSPSLLLAELIERNLLPAKGKTVLELGAGCALPSLLLATLAHDTPSLVVVTDYPDDTILSNLRSNVERNQEAFQPSCGVQWAPFEGVLPEGRRDGYDILILSDLLHFDRSHDVLISSMTSLLSPSTDARAYIAAGSYTRPEVRDTFLRKVEEAGLHVDPGPGSAGDSLSPIRAAGDTHAEWLGKLQVSGLDREQLSARKAVCRYWTARWA